MIAYVLGEIPQDMRRPAVRQIAAALGPDGRLLVAEGAFDPHRQTPDAVEALATGADLRPDGVRRGPISVVITLRSP